MDEIWNELTICISTADTEHAAAICEMVADAGISIEDYSDLEAEVQEIAHVDLIEEDLLNKDRTHSLIHLYLKQKEVLKEAVAFLEERFCAEGITYTLRTTGVKEEDWANNWKKYYHAQKIGKRLAVCPSWESYEPKEDEQVIHLDPGMAFGTGTHETTRLCLGLLEECVSEKTKLLDVGTGSGILAIGAALLGAPQVLGVDIDPIAVKAAKENAERNHISAIAQFVCGDLTDQVSGQYELVTANIVADVILRLLETIKTFLAPGGAWIISGIIDTRAPEVKKACEEAGFVVAKRVDENGWVAMLLRLKS